MSVSPVVVSSILDIPDEILIKIILHLNARERATLANTSKRFRLVFEDKALLRDLDFSTDGRLTSELDIQQYFEDQNTRKHIVKINLANVICVEREQMLNNYIGKALNLVDINLRGLKLNNLQNLGRFLRPLIHVKRLSINWPISAGDDDDVDIRQVLAKPFGRLTFLSVATYSYECLEKFVYVLDLCQELKELHMIQESGYGDWDDFGGTITELENLEILEFCGENASFLKQEFLDMLPDPMKWTEFKLFDPLDEKCFYLAKDLHVCEELLESNCIKEVPNRWEWTLGFYLSTETLLKAVIRITHDKFPMNFCLSKFHDEERCVMKVENTKMLLTNPRHNIKYLYLSQSIGMECDSHLFVLASPYLTELYLSDIMKEKMSSSKQADLQERPESRTHCMHSEKNRSLMDSSFEMLVKSTPHVKDLTLNGRPGHLEYGEAWDLGALHLIHYWENLKSLRLLSLPIHNGEFLVEIGKQCKYLEKLEFCDLGPSHACCYIKELSLMLTHCKNLRDFSMNAHNIGRVSDVFASLCKNSQLRRVRLKSSGKLNDTINLVSFVEELLRRCSKLTTFVCIIDGISQACSVQLTAVLRRLAGEMNRSNLQFQLIRNTDSKVSSNVDTISEDSESPSFPHTWDEFSYL